MKQVVLPTLIFGSVENLVDIRGGTNASMAPQIDYAVEVFGPIAAKMGVQFSCEIKKRGYFPKGMGQVHLKATPIACLKPLELLERGTVQSTTIRSFVSRCDRTDAEKALRNARTIIEGRLGGHAFVENVVVETNTVGAAKGLM